MNKNKIFLFFGGHWSNFNPKKNQSPLFRQFSVGIGNFAIPVPKVKNEELYILPVIYDEDVFSCDELTTLFGMAFPLTVLEIIQEPQRLRMVLEHVNLLPGAHFVKQGHTRNVKFNDYLDIHFIQSTPNFNKVSIESSLDECGFKNRSAPQHHFLLNANARMQMTQSIFDDSYCLDISSFEKEEINPSLNTIHLRRNHEIFHQKTFDR